MSPIPNTERSFMAKLLLSLLISHMLSVPVHISGPCPILWLRRRRSVCPPPRPPLLEDWLRIFLSNFVCCSFLSAFGQWWRTGWRGQVSKARGVAALARWRSTVWHIIEEAARSGLKGWSKVPKTVTAHCWGVIFVSRKQKQSAEGYRHRYPCPVPCMAHALRLSQDAFGSQQTPLAPLCCLQL